MLARIAGQRLLTARAGFKSSRVEPIAGRGALLVGNYGIRLDDRQTEPERQDALGSVARWLKICVSRDGRSVVQVCVPAHAIAHLTHLVPNEVRPRVAESRIDLYRLAAAAAAQECPPGELFNLPGPDTLVRAWLE
jgi:hypothetical protein